MTERSNERAAATNEAALRFLLRAKGAANLADHAALRRFAGAEPAAFEAAILAFAGLAQAPPTRRAPLILRRPDGTRLVLAAAGAAEAMTDALPAELAAAWLPDALARALDAVLLEADLRPDDRLLVAGLAPWPWLAALTQGIPVILASDATPATLLAIAAAEAATAVAAPPSWLAAAGLTAAPTSGPRAIGGIVTP